MTNERLDFEALDGELDAILLDATGLLKSTPWLDRLQILRGRIDHACDIGALAHYQWVALVTRSAKVQDMINIVQGA